MFQILLESLSLLFSTLKASSLQRIGQAAGHFLWLALPARRRLADQAIQVHLKKNAQEARNIAKSSFKESGKAFFELFFNRQIDHRSLQQQVSIDDQDLLLKTLEVQRPVIIVTAHFGAWELLPGFFCLLRGNKNLQIIIRYPKSRNLSRLLDHFRKHNGIELAHKQQATSKVLNSLKKNDLVGFLVDQNCGRSKAVFLRFLQKTAAVNKGPALLALRAQALVLPVFLLRDGPSRFRLIVHPCLDTRLLSGNLKEQINSVADFYTQAVESMVIRYPEQWFWMHRRWKTRPKREDEKR